MRRFLALLLVLVATARGATSLPEYRLAQKDANVLRFVVIGDVGEGAERVTRGVERLKRPIDAAILTGDNIYPCGVTSVHDPKWNRLKPLTRLNVPLLAVLGNHDYCGNEDAQVQATKTFPHWIMPAKEYVVRTSLADLLVIDSTPYAEATSDAARSSVEQAFAGQKQRWRLVAGHHTIISSGGHGYFPRDERNRMRELIPSMRRLAVDLYICGHDHHQELIAGTLRPIHLISGAGSRPIRPIALHRSTKYPHEIGRTPIGFAYVELTRDLLKIRFYDEKAKALSEEFRFGR